MYNSSDTKITVSARLITVNVGLHGWHVAAKVFSRLFMIHVWHCSVADHTAQELLAHPGAVQCPSPVETAPNILGDNTASCSIHSAQLQKWERCIYSREFFSVPLFEIEGCVGGWIVTQEAELWKVCAVHLRSGSERSIVLKKCRREDWPRLHLFWLFLHVLLSALILITWHSGKLVSHWRRMVGRDISVGIATRYGLDGPGIESRWETRFSAPVQTGPGVHPASYTMCTGSFPGIKRPGRDVDHPIHSTPRLMEE